MSRGYQPLEVDKEEVRRLMKEAKTVQEYRRYQAIHLRVSENMDVASISRSIGLSEDSVHRIHSRCRKEGIESASSSKRGGRYRSYLSMEEEKAMLEEIKEKAVKGGVVEISKVHQMFEEKVGQKIARYTSYRLLHRHGWRKISPRPYHPKYDEEKAEAFKKTGEV
jgi:transposase